MDLLTITVVTFMIVALIYFSNKREQKYRKRGSRDDYPGKDSKMSKN